MMRDVQMGQLAFNDKAQTASAFGTWRVRICPNYSSQQCCPSDYG